MISHTRHFTRVIIVAALFILSAAVINAQWNQTNFRGPTGSTGFGTQIVVLSTGDFFVCDPAFDPGGAPGAGAVFLFDGRSNSIISEVKGSRAGDQVCSGGMTELGYDKIVVSSPAWNGGRGAATWMDGTAGVSLVVDHKNSIVGKDLGSQVSLYGVIVLFNRNYVVISPNWADGSRTDLGAVTWGANATRTAGYVSRTNSLVGRTPGDLVGSAFVTALSNGNYVVRSPFWSNGSNAPMAGAATWGDGAVGTSGIVSTNNSIVGSRPGDRVGQSVFRLTNSNYVVGSPQWARGSNLRAGAATFADGRVPTAATVSRSNSLVGTSQDDQVGGRISTLNNGNYVVITANWDDPGTGAVNVGAVTWGKGVGGIYGDVNDSNSKLGTNTNDRVGSGAFASLSNGNFVFASPFWHKERGAVTWGEGNGGNSWGYVSDHNSLAGSSSKDHVGSGGVIPLPGGEYAIASPDWDNYPWTEDAGAVTWGDGHNGSFGLVEAANSLIGSTSGDKVGSGGLVAMRSGNYVALSPNWNWNGNAQAGAATFVRGGPVSDVVSDLNSIHGLAAGDRVGIGGAVAIDQNYAVVSQYWGSRGVDADGIGAVTWGDGINGTVGRVWSGNSIVGAVNGDRVGMANRFTAPNATSNGGIATRLFDQSIVISSPFWGSSGIDTDGVGAVTWFDAQSPTTGVVDAGNSIVGNIRGDLVGSCGQGCYAIEPLQNSGYTIYSSRWDNGSRIDAGAVTLAAPRGGIVGPINSGNSVLGRIAGTAQAGGVLIAYPWLSPTGHLFVGSPLENRVYIIGP